MTETKTHPTGGQTIADDIIDAIAHLGAAVASLDAAAGKARTSAIAHDAPLAWLADKALQLAAAKAREAREVLL
jgi:hypothetical protein